MSRIPKLPGVYTDLIRPHKCLLSVRLGRVIIDIDALDRLRAFVDAHGNQRAAAEALGVSVAFVNQMMTEKIPVSPRILKQLGLRRTIVEDEARAS